MSYNNTLFLNKIKKSVPTVTAASTSTAACLMVIDADADSKNDLDQFMNLQGFVYLCETTQTLVNNKNWGSMTSTEISAIPTEDITKGDMVYDTSNERPKWWDGFGWAIA
jgi:hypothetical protein